MKKNIHRWIVGIAAFAFSTAVTQADFTWFNTTSDQVFQEDGSTPVTSSGSLGVGAFAQLLDLGPDGVFNAAVDASQNLTGVSGDDSVVAIGSMGQGSFAQGILPQNQQIFTADQPNTTYGVRIWELPSPDFGAGEAPNALAGSDDYYADAPLTFTTDGTPDDPAVVNNFDFAAGTGGISTLQQVAIPEPSVLALVVVGLIGIRSLRKRQQL